MNVSRSSADADKPRETLRHLEPWQMLYVYEKNCIQKACIRCMTGSWRSHKVIGIATILQATYYFLLVVGIAFSAWTRSVGHQEGYPACQNLSVRYWRGYLSGARCKWFAYGPADATAISSSLASLKSRMVWPFWCRLTQVVLEKRPLNGCLSISDL